MLNKNFTDTEFQKRRTQWYVTKHCH